MERHAPRGRVQMVKKYLEGDLSITKSLQEALTSCILCEACAHACPSGVRLNRVFENMRMELHETLGPKFTEKDDDGCSPESHVDEARALFSSSTLTFRPE